MRHFLFMAGIAVAIFSLITLSLGNVEGKQMQIAALTSDQAVPPTNATGTGFFIMGPWGSEGSQYMIVLSDVDNVTSVNIEKGGKGKVGDVVVNLFNSTIPIEDTRGILVSGNFSQADIKDFAAFFPPNLFDDNFYVNVNTIDHPTGELRGQLKWIFPFFELFEK